MLSLSSIFQVFKAYGFQVATQKRFQSLQCKCPTFAHVGHLLEMSHFHRSPSTGQLQLLMCAGPPVPVPLKAWIFAFIYIFSQSYLFALFILLLFCYMCKLFRTACVRKQNINKQDPMILHLEIIFRVLLRKDAIQHNMTGRLQVSELCLKLHLWAMEWNSDFFFCESSTIEILLWM